MKKTMQILALMMVVGFLLACRTQPEAAPEPQQPAPTPPPPVVTGVVPTTPVEEAFLDVYQRHISGLILDGATTHTVVSGEFLARIAHNIYGEGEGFFYPLIMLASHEIVLDPDRILPGMVLTVPDLQLNLRDPSARANIRSFLLEFAIIEETRGRHDTAAGMREISARL